MSKLYLVGPVGAWRDLSLRARDLLSRVDLILVQDADRVRPYLEELGPQALLLESGGEGALAGILAALAEGEAAWLVMRISELAGETQALLRALLAEGVDLVSVPGASPMVEGLVASGLPADRFTALGPLPVDREERAALWAVYAHEPATTVCEVRAEDLGAVLSEVLTYLDDRRIAVCQGQDVWRGHVSDPDLTGWEGWVTLVIGGADTTPDWTQERVMDEVRAALAAGGSPSGVAREISRRSGWARRKVYELALEASRGEA
jgi:16S rRNA (cytidine1402-2'-O)-methyltransferase